MPGNSRRAFFTQVSAGIAAIPAASEAVAQASPEAASAAAIDFRYAPLDGQATFCFPDDPHKSLVGSSGELRYGHPGTNTNIDAFTSIVRFSVAGMEADRVIGQELESPGVPIVHTRLERPALQMELITFATNHADEGRVDNVILRLRNRTTRAFHVAPLIHVETAGPMSAAVKGAGDGISWTNVTGPDGHCFMVAGTPLTAFPAFMGSTLAAPALACRPGTPVELLFRFPQQRQTAERLVPALSMSGTLLTEVRQYWARWSAFGGDVRWNLPGRYQEFLTACARNIQQAREVKNGRKTFQVGPTCYRGLWIVDGNFILEAARYLGYDAEAQQGLEATWSHQFPDGGVFASAPGEHWKDTAIAMFTMVRQAELSGDWTYFRAMVPHVLAAADFLKRVRDRAQNENSAMGRYHLLARGFGDGGLNGLRSEFTNTVWTLAGLRAVLQAAERTGLGAEFAPVRQFHDELRTAFFAAAPREMRRHPDGFDYLPMLMKEDEAWDAADEWARPRPQVAQWALSHAIYPGLVFERNDPVVRGHIALMQSCTKEDVPIETGWMPHDSLWTYNAPFVSHVYLWAGVDDWAARTFRGFLNHATPLYCWREEQPLRSGMVSGYWGDMPHNWASAECILYLRHMFALEDGSGLRLLAGVAGAGLSGKEEVVIENTPTRFGRINIRLSPRRNGWRLTYSRAAGNAPAALELPSALPGGFEFSGAENAKVARRSGSILVDPAVDTFVADWKA